jgi:hypothetical protein
MIPAINESELEDIQLVSMRRLWLRDHRNHIIVAAAILLFIGLFFGIRAYNNAAHPLTKFMNASAKNFNSSFTFELEAVKDGKTYMSYSGAYKADPSKQELAITYDADYGDYTYVGSVSASDGTYINGSLYEARWRVHDCTEKVLNFFDFNTDYRAGSFDGASFLRFTGLTNSYSADELNRFMKLFKEHMNGNDPLGKVTVTSEGGSKTYVFDISLKEFFDLVRDKGASIFFSSIDYDAFCALYEKNEQNIRDAECTFGYTITDTGYLSELNASVVVGDEDFAVHCTMDGFGVTEPEIYEPFFNTVVTD